MKHDKQFNFLEGAAWLDRYTQEAENREISLAEWTRGTLREEVVVSALERATKGTISKNQWRFYLEASRRLEPKKGWDDSEIEWIEMVDMVMGMAIKSPSNSRLKARIEEMVQLTPDRVRDWLQYCQSTWVE